MEPNFVEAYHPATGDRATFPETSFEAWQTLGWEPVKSDTPAHEGGPTRAGKSKTSPQPEPEE